MGHLRADGVDDTDSDHLPSNPSARGFSSSSYCRSPSPSSLCLLISSPLSSVSAAADSVPRPSASRSVTSSSCAPSSSCFSSSSSSPFSAAVIPRERPSAEKHDLVLSSVQPFSLGSQRNFFKRTEEQSTCWASEATRMHREFEAEKIDCGGDIQGTAEKQKEREVFDAGLSQTRAPGEEESYPLLLRYALFSNSLTMEQNGNKGVSAGAPYCGSRKLRAITMLGSARTPATANHNHPHLPPGQCALVAPCRGPLQYPLPDASTSSIKEELFGSLKIPATTGCAEKQRGAAGRSPSVMALPVVAALTPTSGGVRSTVAGEVSVLLPDCSGVSIASLASPFFSRFENGEPYRPPQAASVAPAVAAALKATSATYASRGRESTHFEAVLRPRKGNGGQLKAECGFQEHGVFEAPLHGSIECSQYHSVSENSPDICHPLRALIPSSVEQKKHHLYCLLQQLQQLTQKQQQSMIEEGPQRCAEPHQREQIYPSSSMQNDLKLLAYSISPGLQPQCKGLAMQRQRQRQQHKARLLSMPQLWQQQHHGNFARDWHRAHTVETLAQKVSYNLPTQRERRQCILQTTLHRQFVEETTYTAARRQQEHEDGMISDLGLTLRPKGRLTNAEYVQEQPLQQPKPQQAQRHQQQYEQGAGDASQTHLQEEQHHLQDEQASDVGSFKVVHKEAACTKVDKVNPVSHMRAAAMFERGLINDPDPSQGTAAPTTLNGEAPAAAIAEPATPPAKPVRPGFQDPADRRGGANPGAPAQKSEATPRMRPNIGSFPFSAAAEEAFKAEGMTSVAWRVAASSAGARHGMAEARMYTFGERAAQPNRLSGAAVPAMAAMKRTALRDDMNTQPIGGEARRYLAGEKALPGASVEQCGHAVATKKSGEEVAAATSAVQAHRASSIRNMPTEARGPGLVGEAVAVVAGIPAAPPAPAGSPEGQRQAAAARAAGTLAPGNACGLVRRAREPAENVALDYISLEYSYDELYAATAGFSVLLGRGASGSVYKGMLRDGGSVAVKRLHKAKETGFEREVRVLSKFRHPNLVILLGFGRHDNERFLVYELLAGGDVGARLQKDPALCWSDRLSVALDTACALSHLQQRCPQVYHRDIKTANILLDKHNCAKVADFGLAFVAQRSERGCTVQRAAGTVGYADPRYISSSVVTERTEVYSFGMVLLELLTAKPPATLKPDGTITYLRSVIGCSVRSTMRFVDPRANFPPLVAEALAKLAFDCIQDDENRRPVFRDLVHSLRHLRRATQTSVTPTLGGVEPRARTAAFQLVAREMVHPVLRHQMPAHLKSSTVPQPGNPKHALREGPGSRDRPEAAEQRPCIRRPVDVASSARNAQEESCNPFGAGLPRPSNVAALIMRRAQAANAVTALTARFPQSFAAPRKFPQCSKVSTSGGDGRAAHWPRGSAAADAAQPRGTKAHEDPTTVAGNQPNQQIPFQRQNGIQAANACATAAAQHVRGDCVVTRASDPISASAATARAQIQAELRSGDPHNMGRTDASRLGATISANDAGVDDLENVLQRAATVDVALAQCGRKNATSYVESGTEIEGGAREKQQTCAAGKAALVETDFVETGGAAIGRDNAEACGERGAAVPVEKREASHGCKTAHPMAVFMRQSAVGRDRKVAATPGATPALPEGPMMRAAAQLSRLQAPRGVPLAGEHYLRPERARSVQNHGQEERPRAAATVCRRECPEAVRPGAVARESVCAATHSLTHRTAAVAVEGLDQIPRGEMIIRDRKVDGTGQQSSSAAGTSNSLEVPDSYTDRNFSAAAIAGRITAAEGWRGASAATERQESQRWTSATPQLTPVLGVPNENGKRLAADQLQGTEKAAQRREAAAAACTSFQMRTDRYGPAGVRTATDERSNRLRHRERILVREGDGRSSPRSRTSPRGTQPGGAAGLQLPLLQQASDVQQELSIAARAASMQQGAKNEVKETSVSRGSEDDVETAENGDTGNDGRERLSGVWSCIGRLVHLLRDNQQRNSDGSVPQEVPQGSGSRRRSSKTSSHGKQGDDCENSIRTGRHPAQREERQQRPTSESRRQLAQNTGCFSATIQERRYRCSDNTTTTAHQQLQVMGIRERRWHSSTSERHDSSGRGRSGSGNKRGRAFSEGPPSRPDSGSGGTIFVQTRRASNGAQSHQRSSREDRLRETRTVTAELLQHRETAAASALEFLCELLNTQAKLTRSEATALLQAAERFFTCVPAERWQHLRQLQQLRRRDEQQQQHSTTKQQRRAESRQGRQPQDGQLQSDALLLQRQRQQRWMQMQALPAQYQQQAKQQWEDPDRHHVQQSQVTQQDDAEKQGRVLQTSRQPVQQQKEQLQQGQHRIRQQGQRQGDDTGHLQSVQHRIAEPGQRRQQREPRQLQLRQCQQGHQGEELVSRNHQEGQLEERREQLQQEAQRSCGEDLLQIDNQREVSVVHRRQERLRQGEELREDVREAIARQLQRERLLPAPNPQGYAAQQPRNMPQREPMQPALSEKEEEEQMEYEQHRETQHLPENRLLQEQLQQGVHPLHRDNEQEEVHGPQYLQQRNEWLQQRRRLQREELWQIDQQRDAEPTREQLRNQGQHGQQNTDEQRLHRIILQAEQLPPSQPRQQTRQLQRQRATSAQQRRGRTDAEDLHMLTRILGKHVQSEALNEEVRLVYGSHEHRRAVSSARSSSKSSGAQDVYGEAEAAEAEEDNNPTGPQDIQQISAAASREAARNTRGNTSTHRQRPQNTHFASGASASLRSTAAVASGAPPVGLGQRGARTVVARAVTGGNAPVAAGNSRESVAYTAAATQTKGREAYSHAAAAATTTAASGRTTLEEYAAVAAAAAASIREATAGEAPLEREMPGAHLSLRLRRAHSQPELLQRYEGHQAQQQPQRQQQEQEQRQQPRQLQRQQGLQQPQRRQQQEQQQLQRLYRQGQQQPGRQQQQRQQQQQTSTRAGQQEQLRQQTQEQGRRPMWQQEQQREQHSEQHPASRHANGQFTQKQYPRRQKESRATAYVSLEEPVHVAAPWRGACLQPRLQEERREDRGNNVTGVRAAGGNTPRSSNLVAAAGACGADEPSCANALPATLCLGEDALGASAGGGADSPAALCVLDGDAPPARPAGAALFGRRSEEESTEVAHRDYAAEVCGRRPEAETLEIPQQAICNGQVDFRRNTHELLVDDDFEKRDASVREYDFSSEMVSRRGRQQRRQLLQKQQEKERRRQERQEQHERHEQERRQRQLQWVQRNRYMRRERRRQRQLKREDQQQEETQTRVRRNSNDEHVANDDERQQKRAMAQRRRRLRWRLLLLQMSAEERREIYFRDQALGRHDVRGDNTYERAETTMRRHTETVERQSHRNLATGGENTWMPPTAAAVAALERSSLSSSMERELQEWTLSSCSNGNSSNSCLGPIHDGGDLSSCSSSLQSSSSGGEGLHVLLLHAIDAANPDTGKTKAKRATCTHVPELEATAGTHNTAEDGEETRNDEDADESDGKQRASDALWKVWEHHQQQRQEQGLPQPAQQPQRRQRRKRGTRRRRSRGQSDGQPQLSYQRGMREPQQENGSQTISPVQQTPDLNHMRSASVTLPVSSVHQDSPTQSVSDHLQHDRLPGAIQEVVDSEALQYQRIGVQTLSQPPVKHLEVLAEQQQYRPQRQMSGRVTQYYCQQQEEASVASPVHQDLTDIPQTHRETPLRRSSSLDERELTWNRPQQWRGGSRITGTAASMSPHVSITHRPVRAEGPAAQSAQRREHQHLYHAAVSARGNTVSAAIALNQQDHSASALSGSAPRQGIESPELRRPADVRTQQPCRQLPRASLIASALHPRDLSHLEEQQPTVGRGHAEGTQGTFARTTDEYRSAARTTSEEEAPRHHENTTIPFANEILRHAGPAADIPGQAAASPVRAREIEVLASRPQQGVTEETAAHSRVITAPVTARSQQVAAAAGMYNSAAIAAKHVEERERIEAAASRTPMGNFLLEVSSRLRALPARRGGSTAAPAVSYAGTAAAIRDEANEGMGSSNRETPRAITYVGSRTPPTQRNDGRVDTLRGGTDVRTLVERRLNEGVRGPYVGTGTLLRREGTEVSAVLTLSSHAAVRHPPEPRPGHRTAAAVGAVASRPGSVTDTRREGFQCNPTAAPAAGCGGQQAVAASGPNIAATTCSLELQTNAGEAYVTQYIGGGAMRHTNELGGRVVERDFVSGGSQRLPAAEALASGLSHAPQQRPVQTPEGPLPVRQAATQPLHVRQLVLEQSLRAQLLELLVQHMQRAQRGPSAQRLQEQQSPSLQVHIQNQQRQSLLPQQSSYIQEQQQQHSQVRSLLLHQQQPQHQHLAPHIQHQEQQRAPQLQPRIYYQQQQAHLPQVIYYVQQEHPQRLSQVQQQQHQALQPQLQIHNQQQQQYLRLRSLIEHHQQQQLYHQQPQLYHQQQQQPPHLQSRVQHQLQQQHTQSLLYLQQQQQQRLPLQMHTQYQPQQQLLPLQSQIQHQQQQLHPQPHSPVQRQSPQQHPQLLSRIQHQQQQLQPAQLPSPALLQLLQQHLQLQVHIQHQRQQRPPQLQSHIQQQLPQLLQLQSHIQHQQQQQPPQLQGRIQHQQQEHQSLHLQSRIQHQQQEQQLLQLQSRIQHQQQLLQLQLQSHIQQHQQQQAQPRPHIQQQQRQPQEQPLSPQHQQEEGMTAQQGQEQSRQQQEQSWKQQLLGEGRMVEQSVQQQQCQLQRQRLEAQHPQLQKRSLQQYLILAADRQMGDQQQQENAPAILWPRGSTQGAQQHQQQEQRELRQRDVHRAGSSWSTAPTPELTSPQAFCSVLASSAAHAQAELGSRNGFRISNYSGELRQLGEAARSSSQMLLSMLGRRCEGSNTAAAMQRRPPPPPPLPPNGNDMLATVRQDPSGCCRHTQDSNTKVLLIPLPQIMRCTFHRSRGETSIRRSDSSKSRSRTRGQGSSSSRDNRSIKIAGRNTNGLDQRRRHNTGTLSGRRTHSERSKHNTWGRQSSSRFSSKREQHVSHRRPGKRETGDCSRHRRRMSLRQVRDQRALRRYDADECSRPAGAVRASSVSRRSSACWSEHTSEAAARSASRHDRSSERQLGTLREAQDAQSLTQQTLAKEDTRTGRYSAEQNDVRPAAANRSEESDWRNRLLVKEGEAALLLEVLERTGMTATMERTILTEVWAPNGERRTLRLMTYPVGVDGRAKTETGQALMERAAEARQLLTAYNSSAPGAALTAEGAPDSRSLESTTDMQQRHGHRSSGRIRCRSVPTRKCPSRDSSHDSRRPSGGTDEQCGTSLGRWKKTCQAPCREAPASRCVSASGKSRSCRGAASDHHRSPSRGDVSQIITA